METDRLKPPTIAPLWVAMAGIAAQATFSLGPGSGRDLDAYSVAIFLGGLAILTGALVTRSLVQLLVGVPLVWALAGLRWPPGAYDGASGGVALVCGAAYFGLALLWARPTRAGARARIVGPEARAAGAGIEPLFAALIVVGPALALLSPGVRGAAARAFPTAPGRATVAAGAVALLVSIALVTDLARGRPPLRGSRRRAAALGVASLGLLTLWFVVRQAA